MNERIRAIADYLWPRIIIYSLLYWVAILLPTHFEDIDLARMVNRLGSWSSLTVFAAVACFSSCCEIFCRWRLAKRERGAHFLYQAASRLSVVAIEIFTGLVAILTVLSCNILLSIALTIREAKEVIDREHMDPVHQSETLAITLPILIALLIYKEYVLHREGRLTKQYERKKRKKR